MTPRERTRARTKFIRRLLRLPVWKWAQIRPAYGVAPSLTVAERNVLGEARWKKDLARRWRRGSGMTFLMIRKPSP